MTGKVRRIDFSPDEFLVGVTGMTPMVGHTYWVICALIYSSGKPISRDDERIYRIIKAPPYRIREAIDELVNVRAKLSEDALGLHNGRAASELGSAQRRIATAIENGEKGGRPSGKIKDLEKPVGFSEGNPAEKLTTTTTITTNISAPAENTDVPLGLPGISSPSSGRMPEPNGFAEFYMAFPLKKKRPTAAKAYLSASRKGASQSELLAGAQRYAMERKGEDPKYTQHPATWLNAEAWKDEPHQFPANTRSFKCPL